MKRHDTHLLSDESENEEKDEDVHQYIFNSSQNSFKNSEEQYIIKEPNKNNNLYINIINSKKIETNNNISIISSSEIDGNLGNTPNTKNNLNNNKKVNNNKFIKLNKKRFIKDNNDLIVYNYLTYNPSLKKTIFDRKIKKIFLEIILL